MSLEILSRKGEWKGRSRFRCGVQVGGWGREELPRAYWRPYLIVFGEAWSVAGGYLDFQMLDRMGR